MYVLPTFQGTVMPKPVSLSPIISVPTAPVRPLPLPLSFRVNPAPGKIARARGEHRFAAMLASGLPSTGRSLLAAVAPAVALPARAGAALDVVPVTGLALNVVDAALTLSDLGSNTRQLSRLRRAEQTASNALSVFGGGQMQRRGLKDLVRAELPQQEQQRQMLEQIRQQERTHLEHATQALRQKASLADAERTQRRLYLSAFRDVLVQLARTAISAIKLAPVFGASASAAAALPSPLAPALSIVNGAMHFIQGVMEWRQARREHGTAGRHLQVAASLETRGQLDLHKVFRSGAFAREPSRAAAKAALPAAMPRALADVYHGIHQHFVTNQQRLQQAGKLSGQRGLLRMVFGAASTPLGVATLALAVTAASVASMGTALIVLPILTALVSTVWIAYVQRRSRNDRVAEQARQSQQQAQLEAWSMLQRAGANIVQLEAHLLSPQGRNNPYVAAGVMAMHLAMRSHDGARHKSAVRYLLASGMDRMLVRALKLQAANGNMAAVTEALQDHLLGKGPRADTNTAAGLGHP